MKKLAFALTALAALSLLAPTSGSAAQATLGMYLDTEATQFEIASVPAGQRTLYICMVEHDIVSLYGYEYGFTIDGSPMIMSVTNSGTGPIDVGGSLTNHIVGLASPTTCTPVTLIATVNVFVMDALPAYITLHGGTPNSVPGSNTPALLLANDLIIRAGTSGWNDELQEPAPCLSLNATGVIVATDDITLDGIKSLYR